MGRFVGRDRLSVGSLRLKDTCDRGVNLDDEGEVDNTIANDEVLRLLAKLNDWVEAKQVRAARMCAHYWEANPVIGLRYLPFGGQEV